MDYFKVGDRVTYQMPSGAILGPHRVADVEDDWLILDTRISNQVGTRANLTLVKILKSMVETNLTMD